MKLKQKPIEESNLNSPFEEAYNNQFRKFVNDDRDSITSYENLNLKCNKETELDIKDNKEKESEQKNERKDFVESKGKSFIDNKDLEIAKLKQKIESDKEIIDLKQGEIQTVTKNKEAIEMQLGINEVKIRSMEKILNEYKIKANLLEEQNDYMINLIESISKKDKKKYSSYFNNFLIRYIHYFILISNFFQ